jgi:GntR family transcriptional regulator, transcriptional repressor for pyruvate dehydrogenase complex
MKPAIVHLDPPRLMRRPKMAVMVADAIAEEILKKGLSPGVVMATESQMLEQFKVGRATLREALRLLEAEGLITVRAGPNGGAVVQQPSPDRLARLLSVLVTVSGTTLEDVFEARYLIEPELASRAAANVTNAEIKQLEEAIEAQDADRFHSIVATASRNMILGSFWFAVRHIADGQQVGVRYSSELLADSVRSHSKILEAIRRRDSDRAATIMRKHIRANQDYLKGSYRHLLTAPVRLVGVDTPRH